MKKTILAIAAAVMMSANVMAQNDDQQAPQPRQFDPAEMVKQRTEQMVNRYGLSKKQAKQVYEINEKLAYIIAENQPSAPKHEPDNRHGKNIMQKASIAYDLALQKIMNAQQYNDYLADMNAMMPQRHSLNARNHAHMTAHTPLHVRAGRH